MRFKTFEAWENPDYEEDFVERYQSSLEKQEKKMEAEGMFSKMSADDLWEFIYDEEHYVKINEEIEKLVDDNMNRLYYTSFDPETDSYRTTPEYKRIAALHKEKMQAWYKTGRRSGMPKIQKDLIENVFDKCYVDLKKIYQKYIDMMIENRGRILGKKYGF